MSLLHCSMESWQVLGGESSSGGAQLSRCSIARRSILRGWSGCCCCSPGLAMALLLQAFSHPVLSVLSNLQSQQLWTLASWLALEIDRREPKSCQVAFFVVVILKLWHLMGVLHPYPWSALLVSRTLLLQQCFEPCGLENSFEADEVS